MKVTVVGLGYVGSIAAAGLASAGHQVIGADIDRVKIGAYGAGHVPIYEPGLESLVRDAVKAGRLTFQHVDEIAEPLGEVALVSTGTPPTAAGAADLEQVRTAIQWIKNVQPAGCVIAVKSTVPPGTGRRLNQTVLDGHPFRYVSNPEFLREGQAVHDWFHPDRIVIGGFDLDAVDVVRALYSGMSAPIISTDTTSAEMIKYASNAFLATRVSLINEIAALCDRLGASIDDVAEGIGHDPRIGRHFLRAGVGYGGSCFPKDVRAFDQLAVNHAYNFELLRAVITVNNRQRLLPIFALRERFGGLAGLSIAVLGMAFKPNTDDVRESPALDTISLLAEEGAMVRAYDPRASSHARRRLPGTVYFADGLESCLEGVQAVVLMTEWADFIQADWAALAERVKPPRYFFDGRNALDASTMISLGYEYRGIGRGNYRPVSDATRPLVVP